MMCDQREKIKKILSEINGPLWKMKLELDLLLLNDIFPNENSYPNSIWADWVSRIEDGATAESNHIDMMVEHWEPPRGSEKWPCDPSYWINDEHWQSSRLTNNMYAALIVSIWSDMEQFLKNLVKNSYEASEKNGKPLYNIGSIIKFFKKSLSIDLSTISGYSLVNAIRILNNSFKHNEGCYRTDSIGISNKIDQTLLNRWNILDKHHKIDYAAIPTKELILACNAFCHHLLKKVKTSIEAKLAGMAHDDSV